MRMAAIREMSPPYNTPAALLITSFHTSCMIFVFKMAAFNKQKESCLSQVDLSKKGSIDDQIIDLVQYINAQENFFTTSSCSGRISVFSEVSEIKEYFWSL